MHVDTAVFINHLWIYRKYGLNVDALMASLREHGFDPEKPATDWLLLAHSWEYLASVLPAGFDYVKAYCEITPEYLGTLGELIRVSDTSYDAMQHFIEFNRIANDFIRFSLSENREEVTLTLLMPEIARELFPKTYSMAIKAAFCAWVNTISMLSLRRAVPVRMTFTFFDPDPENSYYRRLKCQPLFNAAGNTLVFRKTDLFRPLKSRDNLLFKTVLGIIQKKQQELDSREFRQVVEREIYRFLPFHFPNLGTVSNMLGVSERTIQRRLKAGHLSFKSVSDAVLQSLSMELLRRAEIPVRDIACFLGFSSPSAFTTTFTRWTGKSPMEWRRSMVVGCETQRSSVLFLQ